MYREYVDSSNLYSVGYDEFTNILEIEFVAGHIYRYFGVPFQIYDGLMSARSVGTYFDKRIRKGRYRYKLMRARV